MLYFLLIIPLLAVFTLGSCTKYKSNVQAKSPDNREKSENDQSSNQLESNPEQSKVLMCEEPYAAAIRRSCIPFTCSKCFFSNPKKDSPRIHLTPCSGCERIYYCSKECEWADGSDHQAECRFFRSYEDECPMKDTRLICRMIMKSRGDPKWKAFNGRTYESLMHHRESQKEYRNSEYVKKMFEETRKFMGPEAPNFEEFFLCLCKTIVNAFSIRVFAPERECRGTAIYLGLSIHDHACRPDAYFVFEGSKMILRTTKMDCVYSDKLTISYRSDEIYQTTSQRREQLYDTYYFECKCEECEDVELDLLRTSGRPDCCPDGYFLLDELLCSICGKQVPTSLMQKAKAANLYLSDATFDNFSYSSLLEIFKENKEILSNYNVYLFQLASRLTQKTAMWRTKLEWTRMLTPLIRGIPLVLAKANYLCSIYFIFDRYGKKREIVAALDEALESVKVAYGNDHSLTTNLQLRKKELRNRTFFIEESSISYGLM